MLLVAENIPATSEMVPLIGVYLTTTMALTSTSIILTVFVLHLHHAGPFAPNLSKSFYYFMTRRIAYLIGMSHTVKRYEANTNTSKVKKTKYTDSDKIANERRKSSIKSTLYSCEHDLDSLKYELKNYEEKDNWNSYCFCCCCFKSNNKRKKNYSAFNENLKFQNDKLAHQDVEFHIDESVNINRRDEIAPIKTRNNNIEKLKSIKSLNQDHDSFKLAKTYYTPNSSSFNDKDNSSPRNTQQEDFSSLPNTCCKCIKPIQIYKKKYIESLDIFSNSLKSYLAKQESDNLKES